MPAIPPHPALRVLAQRPVSGVLFLAGWPALLVTALLGQPVAFSLVLVTAYLADQQLCRHGGRLDRALRRMRFPHTVRFLLRQLMLILLLVRTGADGTLVSFALVAFAVYYLLQVPQSALLTLIRRSRKLPVASRNIDLTELHLRDTPPRSVVSGAFEKSMHTDVVAMAGLLVSTTTGATLPGYLGCVAMPALCLVYTGLLARLYLLSLGMPQRQQVLDHINDWLGVHRPTAVLYFSGTRGSAYQVNMWLKTLAASGGRPLVVLRERHILEHLDPTPLPVLCVPSATDLMNADLSAVRLVLYPANVGPNIHMLRIPWAKHAFVGHGDSDKVASINPYAKAYDQVWTAGRAGRDRWAAADVGVRDSAVVEVGRPQLDGVRTGPREAGQSPFTVLYAPTWEGWTNEPGNTSLIESGGALVELLLSLPTPVRILYKPHPYTGIRAPEALAAHHRIVAALERDNAARATAVGTPADGAPRQKGWLRSARGAAGGILAADGELERVEQELAALGTRPRLHADDAERSRDTRFAPADAERREELRNIRDELFWQSTDSWRHQHITSHGPHLYSCFNECDLLVSDVSSVVSDFMASEKPYAITDVEGLGEEEFRSRNPSAGAAFILSRDVHELYEVVQSIRTAGTDPLAAERVRLRRHLLGPEHPDALARFTTAAEELSARARTGQAPDAVLCPGTGSEAGTGPEIVTGPDRESARHAGAGAADAGTGCNDSAVKTAAPQPVHISVPPSSRAATVRTLDCCCDECPGESAGGTAHRGPGST